MGGILSWAVTDAPKSSPNTNVLANSPSTVVLVLNAIGTSMLGAPHREHTARLTLQEF
jgi:hypothetical protein